MSTITNAAADAEAAKANLTFTDQTQAAASAAAVYVKAHPEIIQQLETALPELRQLLTTRAAELRDRVPADYADDVDALKTRTQTILDRIDVRRALGEDVTTELWLLDIAKAEAAQYEAIADTTRAAQLRTVSATIADIAIKVLIAAVLATA